MDQRWSLCRSWAELRESGVVTLSPDEVMRAQLARLLDIEALSALSATLVHKAWLDGVELHGRIEATATRLCGVSLDPFDEQVDTTIDLRLVPQGSSNAPSHGRELVVDLEAADPPETVEGNSVDLATYVTEALALALDPFPRKPGVVFEFTDGKDAISPFAVLKFAKLNNPD